MNRLTSEQAAYLAGIMDGEGSVLVSKSKRQENSCGFRVLCVVQITNTNKKVLEFTQKITGVGKIYNRTESNIRAKRQSYVWRIKHTQCKEFLEQIEPYLIIKKDQARNCIELCSILTTNGQRHPENHVENMLFYWMRSGVLNSSGSWIDSENPPISQHPMFKGKSPEECAELLTKGRDDVWLRSYVKMWYTKSTGS